MGNYKVNITAHVVVPIPVTVILKEIDDRIITDEELIHELAEDEAELMIVEQFKKKGKTENDFDIMETSIDLSSIQKID